MSEQALLEEDASACPSCETDGMQIVAAQSPEHDWQCLNCDEIWADGESLAAEDVRDALRETLDSVVVPAGGHGNNGRLHAPSEDNEEQARCRFAERFRSSGSKPIAVFPRGHKAWCRYCAADVLDAQLARPVVVDHIPDMEADR